MLGTSLPPELLLRPKEADTQAKKMPLSRSRHQLSPEFFGTGHPLKKKTPRVQITIFG